MTISPYLFFDGNCREAIEFYQQTLGAVVRYQMTYAEMPAEDCHDATVSAGDKIAHANLLICDSEVMFSDNLMPGDKSHSGYSLSIEPDSLEQGEQWFHALSQGGNVTMPWGETFWAQGFACFTDKFGVPWMINVRKPMDGPH